MADTDRVAGTVAAVGGVLASPEHRLGELLAKQDISEVVLRYCRGVDRLDLGLVRSCYTDAGIDHHTGIDGSADDYVAWLGVVLPRLTGTMHLIGNHLVEFVGETAYAETYGTAHHWGTPVEDPTCNFVSGFRYVDRFEYERGAWRIAERFAIREWTRSIPPEVVRPKEGVGPEPRRDRTDPVYRSRGA